MGRGRGSVESGRCLRGCVCRSPSSPRWSSPRPQFCCSDPATVSPRRSSSARESTSARHRSVARSDFRSGQLILFGVSTAVELGLLVLVVRRPPAVMRRRPRRPILAGAATAAALSLATGLVTLPVSAIARERAKDVGLVTQSWLGWAGDVAKSRAIGAGLAAGGGALLIVGMRRFGRRWWLPGAGGGDRVRRRVHLRGPDRARSGLQQVHAAEGRAATHGRGRARAPGRRRGGAGATSSTPRVARRPPTPTSPASAGRSASSSTTTSRRTSSPPRRA